MIVKYPTDNMGQRLRDKDEGWKDVVGMPDACVVPLTQNRFAIVDPEDYIKVSNIKWHYEHGYARSDATHGKVYMHRLINNTPQNLVTDHINGNGLDNRKVNLRNATRKENACNAKGARNSSSKYKGVCYIKTTSKWRARIMVDYKEVHLGVFDSEKAAHDSYVSAAKQYQGNFARVSNG